MKKHLVVIAALFLAACADPLLGTSEQLALVRAEKLWRDQALESYSYEVMRICFCPVEVTRMVRVVVEQGVVTGATDVATDTPLPPETLTFFSTIDELFTALRTLESSEAVEEVDVRFDPELGYPRYIDYVPDDDLIDAGLTIETRALSPLP